MQSIPIVPEPTEQDIIDELQSKNQILAIFHALNYIKKHKELFTEYGLGWIDENKFAFNTIIFEEKMGKKHNTVCLNFRTHGFKCHGMVKEMKELVCKKYNLESLPKPKGWRIRSSPYFNQYSTDEDIKQIRYSNDYVRRKKAPITQIQPPPPPTPSLQLILDDSLINLHHNIYLDDSDQDFVSPLDQYDTDNFWPVFD